MKETGNKTRIIFDCFMVNTFIISTYKTLSRIVRDNVTLHISIGCLKFMIGSRRSLYTKRNLCHKYTFILKRVENV